MIVVRVLVAAGLLLGVGCDGTSEVDGGTPEDAAGADGSTRDAGPTSDAGPARDADVDAGPPIDECAAGLDDCPDDARCVDDPVGFHCACTPPRVGDGTTCVEPPASGGMAIGRQHSCVILAGGAVRCFGSNLMGQLGDGARRAPAGYAVDVTLPAPAVDVASGELASCAVLDTGALHCWGRGPTTGVATTSLEVIAPTRVGTESDWRAVRFLAAAYACGLRGAGELWCWGTQLPPFGVSAVVPEPRRVEATVDWVALLAPLCGVTADATLECWEGDADGGFVDAAPGIDVARGDAGCVVDTGGRLYCRVIPPGLETDATAGAFQRVAFGDDWIDVGSGNLGLCGVRADGRIHCAGQQFPRARIDAIEDPIVAPEPVIAIARGGFVTHCARGLSGQVYCWGNNTDGQVGVGTRGTQPAPTRVGDALYTSVSGGYFDTCGTRDDGAVYCWGEVFAFGTTLSPAYVDEPALHHAGSWASAATEGTTRLLVRDDGALFAVGDRPNGLGDAVTSALEPTRVGDQVGWSAVAMREREHACAIRAGELHCWGDASSGQTGDPARPIEVTAPARVGAESDWTAVAVDSDSTCAIRAGELYCFGADYGGSATPTRIGESLGAWTAVAMEDRSACGIADGALYCWGSNSADRVIGGPSTLDSPTAVGAATDWTAVALGHARTCGLRGAGALYCWGANFELLVDAEAELLLDVTRVGTDDDWTQVVLRGSHACALRDAGELYCWGAADNGALGHGTAWVDEPTAILTP